jgi:hypothetical protein
LTVSFAPGEEPSGVVNAGIIAMTPFKSCVVIMFLLPFWSFSSFGQDDPYRKANMLSM